jgi:hypothetical protein
MSPLKKYTSEHTESAEIFICTLSAFYIYPSDMQIKYRITGFLIGDMDQPTRISCSEIFKILAPF